MKDIIIGIVLIVAGTSVIIRRSHWARKTIDDQNRIFGFHFGKKEIQVTRYVGILVGSGFIIFGILALAGIFDFK